MVYVPEKIRWIISDLRKSQTGETVSFYPSAVVSNAAMDRDGNPIDAEEDLTRTVTAVEVTDCRVIPKARSTERGPGGEFEDVDLIIEVDISNQATVDTTKESRGYVVYENENYRIDKIIPLGAVVRNRLRLELAKVML